MPALPDLWHRLQQLQDMFACNDRQFSLLCGLSPTHYNKLKQRNRSMTNVTALAIVRTTGCDYMWLMTGVGDHGLAVSKKTAIRPEIAATLRTALRVSVDGRRRQVAPKDGAKRHVSQTRAKALAASDIRPSQTVRVRKSER